MSRTDELKEEVVGTGAGLFEVQKIGDEYFSFVTECKSPKACTILLRGPSKDILNVRPDPCTPREGIKLGRCGGMCGRCYVRFL